MVSRWMSVCLSICPFIRISFPDDNFNGFSLNLVCALILWRTGLGLLMDIFRQILMEF